MIILKKIKHELEKSHHPELIQKLKKGKFIIPEIGFSNKTEDLLPHFKSIGMLLKNFPSPYDKSSERLIKDPSYEIRIPLNKITDHFYDTGVYASDWDNSKYLKTNHPYMGKMSFLSVVIVMSLSISNCY